MSCVLITGADGHLGYAITQWLLENTDYSLLLWVHATDQNTRQKKHEALATFMLDPRCKLVAGDLQDPKPFDEIKANEVNAIIHTAAIVTFGVSEELARTVNLEGTRRLLEFAETCSQLECCQCLSTIYSAGLREGRIEEAPLTEAETFANYYEWSKWASERLLIDEYAHLPWQILRVATVIAEDDSGLVLRQNVVHHTLRLFYYGLLSVVPGVPQARVYTTTVAFAAAACGRLLTEAPGQTVFHLSDGGDDALSLDGLLDIVYSSFQEDEQFSRLRILKPLFCDWDSFDTLVDGANQFSGVISQSLGSMVPFARELYKDKDVSVEHLRQTLPDLPIPLASEVLPRVCSNLIASRWGLRDK